MKKALLLGLSVVCMGSLNAKSCSEEQIGNMIKQNLSQTTIDSICQEDTASNNKQVIVNITNAPVNTNNNTNTNTNSISQYVATKNDEKEYFFWRLGVGSMSISDTEFSETSANFGLQYFINGLKEDGFGIGWSTSIASQDMEYQKYHSGSYYWSSGYYTTETYSLQEATSELELLYNFNIGNGFSVTPALITGTVTQSYVDKYETTVADESYSLKGFGVYLNFPSIVKSGQGLSLFAKKLTVAEFDQDITLTGLQFVW